MVAPRIIALSLVILLAGQVIGKNILVILPFPFPGIYAPVEILVRELAQKGHRITVLAHTGTTYLENTSRIKSILVVNAFGELIEKYNNWAGRALHADGERNLRAWYHGIMCKCSIVTPRIMKGLVKGLKRADELNKHGNFDLIITQPYPCMEPLLATGVIYNAPIVAIQTVPIVNPEDLPLGNPHRLGHLITGTFLDRSGFGFIRKLLNPFFCVYDLIIAHQRHFPEMDKMMQSYFPSAELPFVTDLIEEIELTLPFHDLKRKRALSLPPNTVELGSVQRFMQLALPKVLEKLMSENKFGVILFYWREEETILNTDEVISSMMNVFFKLKQLVLVIWPHKNITGVPKNVRLFTDLPLSAVLNHSNTKAFITDCGETNIYLGQYFSVPMVVTPLYATHPRNCKVVVEGGYGRSIDVHRIASEPIVMVKAIKEVMSKYMYKDKLLHIRNEHRRYPVPAITESLNSLQLILESNQTALRSEKIRWYELVSTEVTPQIVQFTTIFTAVFLVIAVITCCRKYIRSPPQQTFDFSVEAYAAELKRISNIHEPIRPRRRRYEYPQAPVAVEQAADRPSAPGPSQPPEAGPSQPRAPEPAERPERTQPKVKTRPHMQQVQPAAQVQPPPPPAPAEHQQRERDDRRGRRGRRNQEPVAPPPPLPPAAPAQLDEGPRRRANANRRRNRR